MAAAFLALWWVWCQRNELVQLFGPLFGAFGG